MKYIVFSNNQNKFNGTYIILYTVRTINDVTEGSYHGVYLLAVVGNPHHFFTIKQKGAPMGEASNIIAGPHCKYVNCKKPVWGVGGGLRQPIG